MTSSERSVVSSKHVSAGDMRILDDILACSLAIQRWAARTFPRRDTYIMLACVRPLFAPTNVFLAPWSACARMLAGSGDAAGSSYRLRLPLLPAPLPHLCSTSVSSRRPPRFSLIPPSPFLLSPASRPLGPVCLFTGTSLPDYLPYENPQTMSL